jgi:regulator of sirC expression with transglutaminase-like and TPR domain
VPPVTFAELATASTPSLDDLALALAAEFQPVDAPRARAALDALAAEVPACEDEHEQVAALVGVLGERHGFEGDRDDYDHPDNSMLDLVLERRRGLPIALSVLYVEVARRAGIELAAIGLPGHFVCGHVGPDPPLLVDPFHGGTPISLDATLVRPWGPHAVAMRMLNNLVSAYARRGDLGRALRASELRLALPCRDAERARHEHDLRAMRAQLN